MASHTVYDAVIGAGNNLRQVLSTQFNGGVSVIAGTSSGAPDATDYFISTTEPRASLTTADLTNLLSYVSVTAGLFVSAGTITIPFNQRTNGGTFLSGSNHFTLSSANGLIVPTGFSASQDDEAATATIDIHFMSTTGFLAPVAVNVNQALAAQSFNAQFAFGAVYFGGAQITEAISWSVDPGIQTVVSRHDGGIYPQKIYIVARRPTMTITFEDLDTANTFGAMFSAMTSASVYARKRSAGGTFVADASTVHCKFSFADGVTSTQTISADGVNAGRASVILHGEALTASGASAIP